MNYPIYRVEFLLHCMNCADKDSVNRQTIILSLQIEHLLKILNLFKKGTRVPFVTMENLECIALASQHSSYVMK